jgi:hypothetical protein
MIQWSSRQDNCDSCGQTGDHRAFYPCHTEVERVHLVSRYHRGSLVKVHAPRVTDQRVGSQGDAPPVPVEAAANQPAAVSATYNHTAAQVNIAFRLHMPAGPQDSTRLPGPRAMTPTCLITGRPLLRDDIAKIDSCTTVIGVCRYCNQDASNSSGCRYYWTCCETTFSATGPTQNNIERSAGGTCTESCLRRNCDGRSRVGCTRQCNGCDQTDQSGEVEGGRSFTTSGCGSDTPHRLR